MTTPDDAVANPDGPRDWHRQLEELQDKLRTVEIDRNQMHSRLTRLMDAIGAKTFDAAMAAAVVAKAPPSIPGPVVDIMEEAADLLDLMNRVAGECRSVAAILLARDLRAAAQPGRADQLLRALAAEKED